LPRFPTSPSTRKGKLFIFLFLKIEFAATGSAGQEKTMLQAVIEAYLV
jgi:hypothetical protein